MKLFTNGCSFTWGDEIVENELGNPYDDSNKDHVEFREKSIWSYSLHEKLKTEQLNNNSTCGASNQRIVRTTLDFFTDKIEKGENLKDYIAVIQWTDLSRAELYSDLRQNYINFVPNKNETISEQNLIDLYKNRIRSNPINFENEFHVHLFCLDSFFKLHNVKHLFCTMSTPTKINSYSMPWLGGKIENQLLHLSKDWLYPKQHPNLYGHKIIANKIYKRLKELYNL